MIQKVMYCLTFSNIRDLLSQVHLCPSQNLNGLCSERSFSNRACGFEHQTKLKSLALVDRMALAVMAKMLFLPL